MKKIRLLFDPRRLLLTHPGGSQFPFPLENGDVFSFIVSLMKMPPMRHSEKYADDVRWFGEVYPNPIDESKRPDDDGNVLIEVQTVIPQKGNCELHWRADHENAFLGFAVGDAFDLYTQTGSYTELKIRMLAYVDEIWQDQDDWDEYCGVILPYGEQVGKLIAQEVEVLEVNSF